MALAALSSAVAALLLGCSLACLSLGRLFRLAYLGLLCGCGALAPLGSFSAGSAGLTVLYLDLDICSDLRRLYSDDAEDAAAVTLEKAHLSISFSQQ